MTMRWLILVFVFVTAGCVTPAQITALKMSQDTYRSEVSTSLMEHKMGAITEEELKDEIAAAQMRYDVDIQKKVDEVVAQTEAAIELAKGGVTIVEAVGGGAGLTTIGMFLLNALRNRTRKDDLRDLRKT